MTAGWPGERKEKMAETGTQNQIIFIVTVTISPISVTVIVSLAESVGEERFVSGTGNQAGWAHPLIRYVCYGYNSDTAFSPRNDGSIWDGMSKYITMIRRS